MENAIEITGLRKAYKNFLLDGVSFNAPAGYVTGFIGENGAGKTTTLKLMLGMAHAYGGSARLLGRPMQDVSFKEDIGVLFDQPFYQEDWTAAYVGKALAPFYKTWDSGAYHGYLEKFSLPAGQKFKTFSRGMKMKLGLAVTLSHRAKLLLLDEPTSGLDPAGRAEILDILRDYMADVGGSVFFSTHITSDLEKIADFIVYIHKGRIIYSGQKDGLVEKYCIVRGGPEDLPGAKRERVIGLRRHSSGFEGMVDVADAGGFPRGVVMEPACLDDIMVYTGRA